MKTRTSPDQAGCCTFFFTALLAGMFLAPALCAQPAARTVDNRFLLIFDNSTEMKRRLPAVEKALDILLATSVNQQIRSGDSLGVWTFDQTLHAGQFPLQAWDPDDAMTISSNIITFVSQQHYARTTSFAVLHPSLEQVVQDSERLTVLIFCDGAGEIHGTPYDTGINQIFKQRQGERQKERSPIVIGLRSQRGQYVGCMVSFPPKPISVSTFPPLSEPTPVLPPVTNLPPSPPVPPLIIIGTKHESQPPVALPPPALTNLSAPKVSPVPQSPQLQPTTPSTNVPPPPPAQSGAPAPVVESSLNQPPAPVTESKPPVAQTNVVAAPIANSAAGGNGGLIIAVVLMALAVGLVFLMWRRRQATPQASLITRSMNAEKKSPPPPP